MSYGSSQKEENRPKKPKAKTETNANGQKGRVGNPDKDRESLLARQTGRVLGRIESAQSGHDNNAGLSFSGWRNGLSHHDHDIPATGAGMTSTNDDECELGPNGVAIQGVELFDRL